MRRRWGGAENRQRKFCVVALAIVWIAVGVQSASATALTGASIARFGKVVELRFTMHGAPSRPALSAHGSQLWIDLGHTRIDLPRRPLAGRETSPVDSVRILTTDDGGARLVIEVDQRCDWAMAQSAHALLVRLAPGGSTPNLAAPLLTGRDRVRAARRAGAPRPATELATLRPPAPPAPLAPQPPPVEKPARAGRRPIVMIDPGHGGYDPGTEAGAPLMEKTIALQISLRLARALTARGVDARLTRDGDYFVPLPERTRLANQAGADLFVSIHLNSSPDPNASGIETYYLNNTTDRATIRLARMENAAGGANYGASSALDLNYILSDLRQNYKAAAAASLAGIIEAQTVAVLDAKLGVRVDDLGARQGPFYVLVGALMPAVLIECGFLSNRAEAARLASDSYQQALADGIAGAVVHFLNSDAAVGNL
ncbi:MAG TPA: N-acetylmuramoyl-L-alanine amidase [Candidatus Binataceae bacterium]|nr:N-acetylmuramoyl-L-alanine amidase [Candidatus Binataceae bacterium]